METISIYWNNSQNTNFIALVWCDLLFSGYYFYLKEKNRLELEKYNELHATTKSKKFQLLVRLNEHFSGKLIIWKRFDAIGEYR